MSTGEPWEVYFTPQELSAYNHFFNVASQSKPGIVTGTEAVQFFATSGVPNQILSDIWETADRDNLGYLTRETFFIALKLIACAQHGKEVANNILSTNVPLPQFEGIQFPGSNAATDARPGDRILPPEREKYLQIFQVNQPGGGVMDGDKAKAIFLKSRLPAETLAQIWTLADVRQAGNLNQTEFVIAMHYIAKLMDGTLIKLPNTLPNSVYMSASGGTPPPPLPSAAQVQAQSPAPAVSQRSQTIDSLGSLAFSSDNTHAKNQSQWNISPQEKAQYDSFFYKIDGRGTGYVQGSEAVEFFKNSRLPESELAQIWDIADSEQRGSLTRDEFAVAMHLIHKRLRGEPLTTSKPTIPPSPQVPASSMLSTPSMQPAFIQSPAVTGASLVDDQDLLGDFGNNEQLTRETNEVNQLQNQLGAVNIATSDTTARKVDAAQTLEQLAQQKQQLQAQLAQAKAAHETELAELKELQDKLENEKPSWLQAQQEHDAAQQQLLATQNEIAQLQQTLENGRAESERLRQAVRDIQEETARLNGELENLRAQVKQQNMMLDINRRQVTASEQDREQAQRNLMDFREERGLPDTVLEEIANPSKEAPEAAPQVSSPASSSNFFDIFSSKISEADKDKSKETDKVKPTDFDAIFGNFGSPASSTGQSTSSPFDPAAWATPPERPSSAGSGLQNTSATPTTRSGRSAPPPPPPQSRHHRQASEGQSSISSVTTKKQRAPPPPPPPTASAAITSTTTSTTSSNAAAAKDDIFKELTDDFDAAFSEGQLNEAKVIHSDNTAGSNKNDLNWASSFGGFDYGNDGQPTTMTKDDDWDSIFGAPVDSGSNNNSNNNQDSAPIVGFEDAFSSFGQQPAADSETSVHKPNKEEDEEKKKGQQSQDEPKSIPSTGNSNLEELIKMGFEQKDAKDALERYDQDLAKASNFLLDKSIK